MAAPLPNALVVLSSGIGNVVRWTPAIAMLAESGYAVDVWLASVDYPEVADLLVNTPNVRRVWFTNVCDPLEPYDLACVSHWAPVGDLPIAHRVDRMPAKLWQQQGDPGAMLWHASQLGWQKSIPAPFVRKSDRDFALPNGTLAIHAGCKAGWPWKRYPHFPAIARQFEHVVIVGTAEDSISDPWPFHVRDFVGQLSLLDTAALLSQCSALVCNDSGLSHVGAALGILVFPIYGATDPTREMMPLPHVFTITDQSACYPQCARLSTGRCADRANTPQCLTRLDPAIVADAIRRQIQVPV